MSIGEKQLAVGLISGTSMDGIDACVLEITDNESATASESHQQLKYASYPVKYIYIASALQVGMMLFVI